MPELVESRDDVESNIRSFEMLRTGTNEQSRFWQRRVGNNKYFVVLPTPDGYLFAPRQFSAFKNSVVEHSNEEGWVRRKANHGIDRYLAGPIKPGDDLYDVVDAAYLGVCELNRVRPSRHKLQRLYWLVAADRIALLPEEIPSSAGRYEGAMIQVTVNRYERDTKARAECIAHYGARCLVCSEDFSRTYGARGAGFIHVHHIVPLSSIRQEYQVDPIKDLRPVCPNCHAMLHIGGDLLTVEQLKEVLRRQEPVATGS